MATIMLLPSIVISILYFSEACDQHFNIEINLVASTLATLFIAYNVKRYRCILSTVEFQNAIFANALNHNTEFCLIIHKNEDIVYADARFYERFKDHMGNKASLNQILDAGNILEADKKAFYNALKNNSSVQICISLSKKNRLSNFLVLFEPIPNNPQIAINDNKALNLSFAPIARPSGYFVLKAIKINKEQVYEELIEKHNIGTYVANTKGVILSVNKSFLNMFELKKLEKGSSINDFTSQSKYNNTNETLFVTTRGIPFKAYMSTAVFCDKYNHNYIYGFITPIESNIIDYQLHPCFTNSPIAIAQCDINGNFGEKTFVIASVSCIYGLGAPEGYMNITISVEVGKQIKSQDYFKQSSGVATYFHLIAKTELGELYHLEMMLKNFGNRSANRRSYYKTKIVIFANSHYVTSRPTLLQAIELIKEELEEQLK
ncbi:Hypothetical protein CINCED_3A017403 [Cinara cedri]|uniref:Uncharacterized protein n=1 Tax=Cinara cedri TaxID=506608 RepID=A0A5E4M5I1_9HEMI|nr:Hypothetical protein CINCED_3A017403 [Cinara cedri]